MDLTRRSLLQAAVATPVALAGQRVLGAREDSSQPESAPRLRNDHDLSLPAWGPYTKKYYGISHLPAEASGLRFDLSVCPGFYRRTPMVPTVLWESGYHPWEAAPDLSYYSARFDLEWKDRVYGDLSFTAIDEGTRLLTLDLVNQTTWEQNLAVHLLGSMNFPAGSYKALLPAGGAWVHALDYDNLEFAKPRPTDNLVYDALLRGEVRDPTFVAGSGIGRVFGKDANDLRLRDRNGGRIPEELGRGFGQDAGDTVAYTIQLQHSLRDAILLLRYRTHGSGANAFDLDGAVQGRLELKESAEFTLAEMGIGDLPVGAHVLRVRAVGGPSVDFDGLALLDGSRKSEVRFEPVHYNPRPALLPGPAANSLLLKYPDADVYYGLAWGAAQFRIRELLTDDLDYLLRFYTHNHVSRVLRGNGDGHFTEVFLSPITVPPKSSREIQALLCAGERNAVEKTLEGFREGPRWESLREAARRRRWQPIANPLGEKYAFSQERMAATTLTNVVYPVYFRRWYIKHNSPGRYWDSLYTWDSGFFGLGLLEFDLERSLDCLNAYVTKPGDPYAAFVHHGTPLPVQIYLFHEIWNRTQSRRLLEYFYPRLRQMYLFLAGRLGSSTTRRLKSQLITTWDYFYNSGGWDDYPAQSFVHENKLEPSVAPVSNTAHAIRTAKILRMAAQELGERADETLYDDDIRTWQGALQKYSWDQDSGYFGYVTHDASGNPAGILRHGSGQNFNMALGGASPLFAGICTPTQQERLCGHLMSNQRLWTGIGLTTVDQSAAYYRKDGYWNGAVWMPHQWFLWRGLLDLGRGAEARRIALTALDLWQGEVALTYNCFEHFPVQSGRGAGWHQFSGLSSPVLSWFGAYYRPGRLSCGLDVWINRLEVSADHRQLRAQFRMLPSEATTAAIIAVMQPGIRYQARVDGRTVAADSPIPGVLEVSVPRNGRAEYVLEVLPRD